ncbi:MAG: hypothetical protein GY719_00410 [bacterium]|nr:hypothetical protein [bacterium]
MPSVPSIDRQKASTVFRSVEQSHVRDVLPAVEDQLSEVSGGEETLPDVPLLAALLGRVQVGGTQRLIAADKAHEEELTNDAEPRQRRDETGGRVHDKLVEVRRIAAGLFGPERSAEVLGTPSQTAAVTEGERLWRQARDTVQRLEAPDFTVPVMTTASLQFDPGRLASELETDNTAFRDALDTVALEQRKAEASLAVKKARLDDAERIDAACGRIYEGFFLLADRADLADRLRRALRRVTRRGAAGTDDTSPEPEADPAEDGEPSEAASTED